VIRLIAAFVAAEFAAAVIYAVGFTAEAGMMAGGTADFLVTAALSFYTGLPFVLLGGVPLWLLLRWRQVQSAWMFAVGGSAIALGAYLTLVAMGMSAPSDRPMSFAENLGRAFHIARIVAAMIAGGTGGIVFWSMAVRGYG
jgi:hypothetical protein